MAQKIGTQIHAAEGKLGVLFPGLGAVSTTVMAGVEAVRRGHAKPVGSLTQMGTIRLGKRTDSRTPKISEFVPLAGLDDLVFGAWDIFPEDAYQAAAHAGVLTSEDLALVKPFLQTIKPMPGVFDPSYVRKLSGTHVKTGRSKMDLAQQLIADIENFKKTTGVTRCVAVWCGSTEVYQKPGPCHQSLAEFEKGLECSDVSIAPSAIYAYACLRRESPLPTARPTWRSIFPP